jgi:tetratricopeptide (TPR) repeat protein
MLEGQEFEQAASALEAARAAGGLEPEQLAEVYRGLAECAAALRQPDEAEAAFRRLLALDPDAQLPEMASPLVREPFEQAAAFWVGKQRPALRYDPPGEASARSDLVVEADVVEGALEGFVKTVSLHLRRADGSYDVWEDERGRFEVPSEALSDLDEAELYLALRDEYGNLVQRLGDPEDPFRVELTGRRRGPGPAVERPWYHEWWVWTLIGVGVAGVAVAVPVGILYGGGAGGPCQNALGHGCDATVTFGAD